MHVEELLGLEALDLRLLWADPDLLAQEITGVTATDLEDPSRFLQRGELVLSGLVWWSADEGHHKADRFVSALRTTGAAALLAGEETHGTVPDHLVEACRTHRIALLSVPAHTNFRTITDAVYLRRWGDLSRQPSDTQALPATVRRQLADLLAQQAPLADLLGCAFSHLGGVSCRIVTPTGRTLAATPEAGTPDPADVRATLARAAATTIPLDPAASPYDTPHLCLPDPDQVPPRVLREIADVIAQRLADARTAAAPLRQAADRLVTLIGERTADAAALAAALTACGLPTDLPATVVTVQIAGDHGAWATAALGEALNCAGADSFAVGSHADGEATAVLSGSAVPDLADRLRTIWPVLHAIAPDAPVHGGIGNPAATPGDLPGGLSQARYASTAAQSPRPDVSAVRAAEDLSSLAALIAGVPAEVRAAFHHRVLGALTAQDEKTNGTLMETLEVFLAHDGSWSRSAEALHVHVNTVHYRLQRIEQITGRDLSRLADRLDLRAALLCRA
ncbi:PucR family transcriptional regulator [Streptomyces sp. NPDC054933]